MCEVERFPSCGPCCARYGVVLEHIFVCEVKTIPPVNLVAHVTYVHTIDGSREGLWDSSLKMVRIHSLG